MGRPRRRGRIAVAVNSEDEMDEDDQENEREPTPGTSTSSSTHNSQLLSDEVDMSDTVITGLRMGMDNLVNLVRDILPTCYNDEKRNEAVLRLKACMLKLIKSEVSYLEGLKIVERTGNQLPNTEEDADESTILGQCEQLKLKSLEKINEHRKTLKDEMLMKHVNYTRLVKEIDDTGNSARKNDEGESETDTESQGEGDTTIADLEGGNNEDTVEMIPTIDPITKLPLTDPVRNKHCNHIYGKAAILQIIDGGKGKTRCPKMGCANKKWIAPDHLIDDPELTRKVLRQIKKEANRTKHPRAQKPQQHIVEDI